VQEIIVQILLHQILVQQEITVLLVQQLKLCVLLEIIVLPDLVQKPLAQLDIIVLMERQE
jgi:hypothetical protein